MKNKNKPVKPKSSKKKKIITIQGQPKHRDYPGGAKYDITSSFGAVVCSTKNQDLTQSQIKAFRKRLTMKEMRRKFRTRCSPYLPLTKKPSEVRMGKGRGVKINRIVNPLVKGSIIAEIPISVHFRFPNETGLGVYYTFLRASRKLPTSYKVLRCDL